LEPSGDPAAVKWFQIAIEKGSADRTIAPWVHKDGSIHIFEWRSSFIHGSEDRVRFVVVVGNDITDDDQNLKELQRAAAVFENSSEGIVIADKNAIILDTNGGYTRITGYSRAESIGKNAGFIGSGIHDRAFYQDMYDSLKKRSRWSGTIWNRRKDGEEFPALIHITAIRNSYGTGKKSLAGLSVPWIKVDDLPDYVYFNHEAHVNAGISCLVCHGKVNEMTRVYQAKPFNMAWCLNCHRNPAPYLRPRNEVTNMSWTGKNKVKLAKDLGLTVATLPHNLGKYLMKRYHIPSVKLLTDCETCHR
jgi:PAS domain S-box-containing protein